MATRPFWVVAQLFLWSYLLSSSVAAGTIGALYNMDRMLREAHPFSRPYISPTTPAGVTSESLTLSPSLQRPMKPKSQGQTQETSPRRMTPPKLTGSAMPAKDRSDRSIFSEMRGGLLAHDFGPFSHRKEKGIDINAEVLFTSPDFMDIIWLPRPTAGGSFNSSGDTSQGYLGLTWEWDFLEHAFLSFFWGGAVHNGGKNPNVPDKKDLGCRVLFREGLDLGWRFSRNHALMAHLDHISNAKLCGENEGLESLGLRYGYQF